MSNFFFHCKQVTLQSNHKKFEHDWPLYLFPHLVCAQVCCNHDSCVFHSHFHLVVQPRQQKWYVHHHHLATHLAIRHWDYFTFASNAPWIDVTKNMELWILNKFKCLGWTQRNMVIEDERLNNMEGFEHVATIQMYIELIFNSYMEFTEELENQNRHLSLQSDLVEHLWVLKGSNFLEINLDFWTFNFKLSWIFKIAF